MGFTRNLRLRRSRRPIAQRHRENPTIPNPPPAFTAIVTDVAQNDETLNLFHYYLDRAVTQIPTTFMHIRITQQDPEVNTWDAVSYDLSPDGLILNVTFPAGVPAIGGGVVITWRIDENPQNCFDPNLVPDQAGTVIPL